jgi:hypothetical protein
LEIKVTKTRERERVPEEEEEGGERGRRRLCSCSSIGELVQRSAEISFLFYGAHIICGLSKCSKLRKIIPHTLFKFYFMEEYPKKKRYVIKREIGLK